MTEAMCYNLRLKCKRFEINVYRAFRNGLVLCRDVLNLPY